MPPYDIRLDPLPTPRY